MIFSPFWAGGIALAAVALGHFLISGRYLAVSGRISALVDRTRSRPSGSASTDLTNEELAAAVRAMTLETFGPEAVPDVATKSPPMRARRAAHHGLFFLGLVLGGAIAAFAFELAPARALAGTGFAATFGSGPGALVLLFGGGLLVGFGTRMSGGCTSGHGLFGVPFMKPGSLVATACFFGAGIATSFALEALR
jgi:uncharacterized protein